MGAVPLRATATEEGLRGATVAPATVSAAAALADHDTAPPSDHNADATFRRHLARVLTARALGRALGIDVPDPES